MFHFISNAQLPDNVQKVLLLTNLSDEAPHTDRFMEVFGEAVLYDKTMHYSDDVSSIPCTTSLDIFRTRFVYVMMCKIYLFTHQNDFNVSDCRCITEEVNGAVDENYHSIIADTYVPAIKVHKIVPIENAHEIINCNLKLELIKDNDGTNT